MHKKSSCSQLWQFPCERCGNRYKNKEKLREHILTKCGAEKLFVCKVCNNSYLYERQLVEHLTPVCKNSSLFRCDFCNHAYKSLERLNEHVLSRCDSEKVFKCDTCKKRYILKSQLIDHLTPICRAIRQFQCEHCELTFKRASLLNSHKENFHGIGNQILCDKCGEVLIGSEQFRAHSKKHLFKKSSLDLFDLEEKSYVCKLCGKSLTKKDSLRGHLRKHYNGSIHACNICGKSLSKNSLRSHMRTHTNLAKSFCCTICKKGFNYRRDLERHLARHSNDKPHSCRDCGKSFSTMEQLKSHSAVHTGVNVKTCHFCGGRYLSSSSLRRHVRRVHLTKRDNSCSQCGKMFKTFQEVANHHRYEPNCAEIKSDDKKPYVCTDCEACFESSESFLCHTGVNISDQPLRCTTCGKCFSRITCLNLHLLSHPDTFNCGKCNESFGDSLSLALHDAVCGITLNDSNEEFILTAPDDKTCYCNQCGGQFNNIYELTCHALTHIDYEGKLESLDFKSKNDHLYEDTYVQKQNFIDISLKVDGVNYVNSEHDNKDSYNLIHIRDMPIKAENNPGVNLPVDNFPMDNHNEELTKINKEIENHPIKIQSETLLHPKVDVPINKFACNECGKCLAHSRSLRRHMMTVHSHLHNKTAETPSVEFVRPAPEVNTFDSKVCGTSFKEVKHLINHVREENLNTKQENPPNLSSKQLSEAGENFFQNKSPNKISESGATLVKRENNPKKVSTKQGSEPQEKFIQNRSIRQINEPGVTARVPVCEIKGVSQIVCMRCGNNFSEIQQMNSHICSLNPGQNNKVQNSNQKKTDGSSHSHSVIVRERKPAVCESCGRIFSEARHLKRHICKVQTTQNNIHQSSDLQHEPSRSRPVHVDGKKPVICEGCGKSFSEARNLKRHICKVLSNEGRSNVLQKNSNNHVYEPLPFVETHELKEDKPLFKEAGIAYSMPLLNSSCDNDLIGGSSINQERQMSHNVIKGEKVPKCYKYEKSLSDLQSLKRHDEKSHSQLTKIETLRCDVCGKVFQQRYNLNRHKLVHITETPFKCYVCDKLFKLENILQSHIVKAHSSLPNVSPLPCNECGEFFADKSCLEDHSCQARQRYECDHCGVSFKKCSSLSKHQIVAHSDNSKCSICHISCTSTDVLFEHMRSVHKEIIDESATIEDIICLYSKKSSLSEKTRSNTEVVSAMGTKRVELKLPLNDKNMLMFEAYESLLLEACPLDPSVSAIKFNRDMNHDSSQEELVKLEYVLGS